MTEGGVTKRCSRCRRTLPLAQFSRDKQAPDGLNRRCRTCKNEMSREWREHSDRRKEYEREYYEKNREKVVDYAREWRAANHEAHLGAKRRWREKNPDHHRTHYEANKDRYAERTSRRRALLADATCGPVDLGALWDECGGRCGLCGEPIDRTLKWPDPMSASLDHIVPLSRGGTHEQSNLQWTHLVENIRKGASVPVVSATAESPS